MSNLRFALRALGTAGAVPLRRVLRGPGRPSWSLRTELVRDVMRSALDGSLEWGVLWLRAFAERGTLPSAALKQVEIRPVDAGGIPAEWVIPRAGAEPRALAYLHGGGFVMGSPASYRDFAARLALACRARVLLVDYRLAPQHPFPAAHDDAFTAWRWLAEEGAAGDACAVGGDSAGGMLAAHVCIAARDAGGPAPRAGLLLSPWTDPEASGGSMESNEAYDILSRAFVGLCRETYLAGADVRDPRMSLVNVDLHGLAPLLVQGAAAEIFRDQMKAFVEGAQKAGVDAELSLHPDQFHVYQTLPALLPDALPAIGEIAAWLEPRW